MLRSINAVSATMSFFNPNSFCDNALVEADVVSDFVSQRGDRDTNDMNQRLHESERILTQLLFT
jgi:hypothetical protein